LSTSVKRSEQHSKPSLKQFLPQDTQETDDYQTYVAESCERNPREPRVHPQFFYSCKYSFSQLLRTNLLTGELSCHQVPGYRFNEYCRLNLLPEGSLLITGGGFPQRKEVVKIDAPKEYAVCSQPPMHTARADHAAVYHSQYLYVLGGQDVSKCERLLCAERQWEVLPDLPVACTAMCAVELDNSVYVLGGFSRGYLDNVLKLSLDSLTWKHMRVKLPRATSWFPCFTTDTQVYLLIEETLYSFTPFEVKLIKTLDVGELA
jgi:hypothetical protein